MAPAQSLNTKPTPKPAPALRRILVVPLRFIGDTILTVPLIQNLKHHYPQAEIDVLVSKTAAPLLELCPDIHTLLVEARGLPKQLQQLKQGHYDAIFILRKSVTLSLLAAMAGIPLRIGYDKQRWFAPLHYKRWGIGLTHTVRYPSLKTETPQVLSHLKHLAPLGLAPNTTALRLWASDEETQTVQTRLAQLPDAGKPIAVLHLVSASHGKSFEAAQFLDVTQRLAQKGFTLIGSGIEADRPQYETLSAQSGVSIHNWAGTTSLRETFALYQQAQVIVTVDSSPIHFAAAANIPNIIGVFGPTNEKQWGPYSDTSHFEAVFMDLPCRPCYAKVCSHNSCRLTLTGNMITAALERSLNATGFQSPPV